MLIDFWLAKKFLFLRGPVGIRFLHVMRFYYKVFSFYVMVMILQVYFGIKLKSFTNMRLNLTGQTKTQIKDKMFLDIKPLRL